MPRAATAEQAKFALDAICAASGITYEVSPMRHDTMFGGRTCDAELRAPRGFSFDTGLHGLVSAGCKSVAEAYRQLVQDAGEWPLHPCDDDCHCKIENEDA